MFATMVGIDTDGAGFRKVVIHPQPGGGITYAKGSYDSINGPIAADWKFDDNGMLTLNVSIPPNTAATIFVPAKEKSVVAESHGPVSLKFDADAQAMVCQVRSGSYSFTVK